MKLSKIIFQKMLEGLKEGCRLQIGEGLSLIYCGVKFNGKIKYCKHCKKAIKMLEGK